jgi:DNA modification methylase
LVACLQTNRVGIGIEINQDYCQLAAKRLSQQEA